MVQTGYLNPYHKMRIFRLKKIIKSENEKSCGKSYQDKLEI
jgi:hypothetical protein